MIKSNKIQVNTATIYRFPSTENFEGKEGHE